MEVCTLLLLLVLVLLDVCVFYRLQKFCAAVRGEKGAPRRPGRTRHLSMHRNSIAAYKAGGSPRAPLAKSGGAPRTERNKQDK